MPGGIYFAHDNSLPNRDALHETRIPVYACPSTNLSEVSTITACPSCPGSTVLQQNSYVLIRGANDDPSTDNTALRGPVSQGGTFFHNSRVRMRDVVDGTSNTMCIGEQSAAITRGSNQDYDVRPQGASGAWMGQSVDSNDVSGNDTYGNNTTNGDRCFNLTTIHDQVPIGLDHTLADPDGTGIPGTRAEDCNTPLVSPHDGGVHILLLDGAVRFISENIDMQTARNLANKKDRNVIGDSNAS